MDDGVVRRKPRDKSKKRDSILDAAIKAYELYGYYSSSMDLIAEIAGASKRTVYNHFKSKEELFDCVISRYLKGQENLSDYTFSSERPLFDQLSDIANSEIYLVETESNRALSKVLTSVFLIDMELGMKTKQKYKKIRGYIFKWFEDAAKAGVINTESVEKEVNIFISMIQGYITWPALFTPYNKEVVENKKAEIINRYLAAL